ncbi:hypothetical protein NXS19_005862 [Fusarium pseudograminearum]|nr:hypothetical protein NXS19_005862 [Fusarium pseudograminearum]
MVPLLIALSALLGIVQCPGPKATRRRTRRRDLFPKNKFTYIKGSALTTPCDTSRDFLPLIHSPLISGRSV